MVSRARLQYSFITRIFTVIYNRVIERFTRFTVDMTQRQLEVFRYGINYDEFQRVVFSNNEVTCELNDRFSIVIKRQRHSVQVFLKSGRRRLKLPFSVFEGLNNSQISITYLKRFLEEN